MYQGNENGSWQGGEPSPRGPYTPERMPYAPAAPKRTGPSGVLTFVLSFCPGAGYMYLGLMKRGAFILSGFFLLCYLAAEFHSLLAGMSIAVVAITQFFGAIRAAHDLRAGKAISDSFDDILFFLRKYGAIILGLIAIDILHGFVQRYVHFLSPVLPVLFIALGVYLVITRTKAKASAGDFVDKRGN